MGIRREFNQWKQDNNQHGRNAYSRFVMLKFLERLFEKTGDFVFKGGNLLWFYINTPRPTVDLDLSSAIEMDSAEALDRIQMACTAEKGLSFKLLKHQVVDKGEAVGIKLTIAFEDESGGANRFGVDVVLGIATDIKKVRIGSVDVNAASIENIIVDKVAACRQFGSGNTRAKDYDDLYRIVTTNPDIDTKLLSRLSRLRGVELKMESHWIGDVVEDAWKNHLKIYKKKVLPADIAEVFTAVNEFFNSVK